MINNLSNLKVSMLGLVIVPILGIMLVSMPIYAMNSYDYGYQVAKNEWSNCGVNSNGTCWSGSAYCYNAIYNVTTGKDIQTHVSNPTSCMNGFVTSWNQLCRVESKIAKVEQIRCPTSIGQEMPHF